MIPSYFKIEILAISDRFVTQGHKGLIAYLFAHEVVRAFEEVFQNSWVRAEQRRNYQELLSPDSSPAVCCRNANILNSLSFIPSYKILGSNVSMLH